MPWKVLAFIPNQCSRCPHTLIFHTSSPPLTDAPYVPDPINETHWRERLCPILLLAVAWFLFIRLLFTKLTRTFSSTRTGRHFEWGRRKRRRNSNYYFMLGFSFLPVRLPSLGDFQYISLFRWPYLGGPRASSQPCPWECKTIPHKCLRNESPTNLYRSLFLSVHIPLSFLLLNILFFFAKRNNSVLHTFCRLLASLCDAAYRLFFCLETSFFSCIFPPKLSNSLAKKNPDRCPVPD